MNVYLPYTARLPSAYQEVEYIQSSGTQYIDTGLKPTDATFGFKGKVSMTALSGDRIICALYGYTSASGQVRNCKYGFGGYNSQWQTYNIMTSDIGWANSGSLSLNTPYEFTFNYNSDRKLTVNGNDVRTGLTAGSYTYSRNWNLFCDTNDQTGYTDRYTSCKLYYFQIYKGTTLVRDFVPCYRKSDNVIGLYDLVNKQFYTNSGSGTFTKGADVYTNVLRNAYIGEYKGWKPNEHTKLYLPLNGDVKDPYNNVTYNWVGTSSFATWSTGVQAANFTGSNCVALGTSKDFINGTGECTILFWFTTTSPSTVQRCSLNVSGKYFMINSIRSGKLCGSLKTSSNEYDVYGTTSIVANTKYLATITRKENGKMCVYLNGNLEGQTNISGTFASLQYQFGQHIGAGRTGDSEFWRGMIKDFIIENRERTADEVLAYYNQTK